MDAITETILGGVVFFLIIGAFLLGKWQDLNWRTKIKRRYLKKSYAMVRFIDKDSKSELLTTVNLTNDIITFDDHTFIAKADRIYREDKEETQVKVRKKIMKWEEGVPIITLDRSTLQPLDYDYGDKSSSSIKPDELGATIGAHDAIQLQKSLTGKNNVQTLLIVLIFIAGITAIIAFGAMGAASDARDAVHALQNSSSFQAAQLPPGGSLSANGSLVIKGPGVK